jgi:hypothetical protein
VRTVLINAYQANNNVHIELSTRFLIGYCAKSQLSLAYAELKLNIAGLENIDAKSTVFKGFSY